MTRWPDDPIWKYNLSGTLLIRTPSPNDSPTSKSDLSLRLHGKREVHGGQFAGGALGWPLIDLDTVIEAGQGLSIREIFENSGEPFFRQIERAALTEASKAEPAVIALGGGTFAQPPNVDLIRESGGTTVWLDCPPELLRARCEGMEHRPLFRDEQSFTSFLWNE